MLDKTAIYLWLMIAAALLAGAVSIALNLVTLLLQGRITFRMKWREVTRVVREEDSRFRGPLVGVFIVVAIVFLVAEWLGLLDALVGFITGAV